MRVQLVVNSSAGNGKVSANQLLRLIRNVGHDVDCLSKKDDSLADHLQQPADLIAVAGGDGTVAKVAMLLPAPGPPIAILPHGTANNIARSLGISESPERSISQWSSADRKRIDIWSIAGPWGERHFIEGCGFGALTQTALQMTSRETSNMSGDEKLIEARRLFHDLRRSTSGVSIRGKLDGEVFEGKYSLFEVLNLSSIGPNLSLAPRADPGDGLLDVVLSKGNSDSPPDKRFSLRCKYLTLSVDGGRIHIDDEFWPEAGQAESKVPFTATIRPSNRSLTVLLS